MPAPSQMPDTTLPIDPTELTPPTPKRARDGLVRWRCYHKLVKHVCPKCGSIFLYCPRCHPEEDLCFACKPLEIKSPSRIGVFYRGVAREETRQGNKRSRIEKELKDIRHRQGGHMQACGNWVSVNAAQNKLKKCKDKYWADPEAARAKNRKYYQDHLEHMREVKARYAREHPQESPQAIHPGKGGCNP
jgi:hypothetical protein